MSIEPKTELTAWVAGFVATIATLCALSIFTGCASIRDKVREELGKINLPTEGEPDKPTPDKQTGDSIDLSTVVWHGTDIRNWPVTTTLDASISDGKVYLRNEGTRRWKDVGARGSGGQVLVGNAWVICMIEGKWQAATWEWLGQNQQDKAFSAVAGDHIKRSPWPNDWRPKSGDKLHFGVTGLARDNRRNNQERGVFVEVVVP